MNPEFIIYLREHRRQIRFPRSKKRRIRRKWRRNPANWGDDLRVFENVYIGGPLSCLPPPEKMPRFLEMHPRAWDIIQANNPAFSARCEIWKRKEVTDWFTLPARSA